MNMQQTVPQTDEQHVSLPNREGKTRPAAGFFGKIAPLVILIAAIGAGVIAMDHPQVLGLRAGSSTASLRFPSLLTIPVTNEFVVPVLLDTQGSSVVAVDVSASFDPSMLALLAVDPVAQQGTSFHLFLPTDTTHVMFDSGRVVAGANATGDMRFSAATLDLPLRERLPAYSGATQLAALRFRAKSPGTTTVRFRMAAGSTTDSNIVVGGSPPVDILTDPSQITDLHLTITPGPLPAVSGTPTPTGGTSPTPTPTVPPLQTPVTLAAIKDTYVDGSSARTSYGGSSTLYVDGSPKKVTYLEFDLSGVSGQSFARATLSFQSTSGTYSGSPNPVEVYLVDSSAWPETMTYDDKPEVSSTRIGRVLASKSNTVYTLDLDVSRLRQVAGGVFSLAIVPTGEDALYFYSKESGVYTPQLHLDPSPSGSGSSLTIFAAGTASGGIYPTMDLLIDDRVVASYQQVSGDPGKRQFVAYQYASSQKLSAHQIKVRFTNDTRTLLGDRNLVVDKIVLDNTEFQSESPSVYATGAWTRSTRCTKGYYKTEWLYCNGYFRY